MAEYVIVGLGNPGREYEYTRHNLGFLVVQNLIETLNVKLKSSSFTKGLFVKGSLEGIKISLLLPMTFMNNSGIAVKQFLSYYKFSLENTLIICDDLNLDFGQLRLRGKGGAGGHNGLSSIIQHCGTQDFTRLRMGIDCPKNKQDIVNYVLRDFSKAEKIDLDEFIKRSAECCLTWVREGVHSAMDKYNRK